MKRWLSPLLVAFAAFAVPAAMAQQGPYPNRPIKIVVANPPGGQTDVASRIIAQEMSNILKQPVVIENKPGANSNLGAEYVKNQPADGYTLIVTAINNFGSNPALIKNMPFDPLGDFRMIVQTIASPNVLVVAPESRFKTLQDILSAAKAEPGKLTYGSAGAGSSMFLFMELLKSLTKVDIRHVPYQGSARANVDLMGGQIDMQFDSMPGASALIEGKKLRPIVISSAKRSPVLPDVPTVQESGVAGFEAESWLGFGAPKGTPDEVIAILNKAANQALQTPKVRDQLLGMGTRPVGGTPQEFTAFVQKQIAMWKKVVADNNLQN
ncbi:tripartite tricarboxylate transporter substrate binding protein [Ramlibacter henchirensis]|uniref:Tripartite tricarboxylate transporter substrate binding protein n=1 Tax=Ramlibacter henchirensis TaxID=204072 RepID=A0A4Z0BWF1_9BURK|nr:tripartite tricarboxylate transporter substrate binding protein [Ramlibacter henchirensis]TFZ02814.1 tripartite tricarboxylate transporter substrate binding protein [Ramlibacter henchirensis]